MPEANHREIAVLGMKQYEGNVGRQQHHYPTSEKLPA
jgi:hypothetical protein